MKKLKAETESLNNIFTLKTIDRKAFFFDLIMIGFNSQIVLNK